jgi:DNA repair ATPase RecN
LKKLIKTSQKDLQSLKAISEKLRQQLLMMNDNSDKENKCTSNKKDTLCKGTVAQFIDFENKYLYERNKEYEDKLKNAMDNIKDYQEEINKSIFELDIYRNQVDRLTNLTKSQEKVISYLGSSCHNR